MEVFRQWSAALSLRTGGVGGKEGIRRDRGMGLISYPTPSLLFPALSIFFAPSLQSERFEQARMGVKPAGADPHFLLGGGVPLRNGVTDW